MARRPSARGVGNVVLIALLSGVLVTQAIQAIANHEPADKVSVAAASIDATPLLAIPTQQAGNATAETTIPILDTTMRVSSPSDLVLALSAECALWTNTATDPFDDEGATNGQDHQESIARVEVFLTLDDMIVPVADGEAAGGATTNPDVVAQRGHVVYCNRAVRQQVEGFDEEDDEDEIIRLYNRTRSSNAFSWIAQDVGVDCPDPQTDPVTECYDNGSGGNNVIHVEAFARLAVEVICDHGAEDPNKVCPLTVTNDGVQNPAARAAVGKRSLVIEPTKLINDEDVNETDPPPAP
jgi:hypothetical protein